jgi:hypothetical protein
MAFIGDTTALKIKAAGMAVAPLELAWFPID